MAESGYDKFREDVGDPAASEVAEAERRFMAGVYNWMMTGLVITAFTAWRVAVAMADKTSFFWRNPGIFFVLLLCDVQHGNSEGKASYRPFMQSVLR